MRNRLPLTVSEDLWNAVADATSVEFTDSYLSGARETKRELITHTVTGYERFKANRWAMSVLVDRDQTLIKPLPFGHPMRHDADRARI